MLGSNCAGVKHIGATVTAPVVLSVSSVDGWRPPRNYSRADPNPRINRERT